LDTRHRIEDNKDKKATQKTKMMSNMDPVVNNHVIKNMLFIVIV
jgi:hypothetical protein